MSCLTEKKYVKNVEISIVKTGSEESNITYLFSLFSKDLIRRPKSQQAVPDHPTQCQVVEAIVPHALRRVNVNGWGRFERGWSDKWLQS
jgi:hypothetical protein